MRGLHARCFAIGVSQLTPGRWLPLLKGGEKRRVSIAAELLTRPAVLFLDEPTTGLDSTNAARVVDVLQALAAGGGVNVLLSIHQPRPDIFRLMDRIMILSGAGIPVRQSVKSVSQSASQSWPLR